MRIAVYSILIIWLLVSIGCERSFKSLENPEKVRLARIWTALISVTTFFVAMILIAAFIYSYSSFLFIVYPVTLACIAMQTVNILKAYRALKPPTNKIIASWFDKMADEYFAQHLLAKATKARETACQWDPDDPVYWISLAVHDDDSEKAESYIEKAEKVIEEKGLQSKELIAYLEFSKGFVLFLTQPENKNRILEHFETSLNIHYDKKTADLMKKVKQRLEPIM